MQQLLLIFVFVSVCLCLDIKSCDDTVERAALVQSVHTTWSGIYGISQILTIRVRLYWVLYYYYVCVHYWASLISFRTLIFVRLLIVKSPPLPLTTRAPHIAHAYSTNSGSSICKQRTYNDSTLLRLNSTHHSTLITRRTTYCTRNQVLLINYSSEDRSKDKPSEVA